MYEAARKDDHVRHSRELEGTIISIGAGIIAIAFPPTAIAMAVVSIAAPLVGSFMKYDAGPIETGASTVKIGRLPAARAVVDKLSCHKGKVIAQGSFTVAVENFPAARIDDQLQCGGSIGEACSNVFIGREPATYVHIEGEVPVWLQVVDFAIGMLDGKSFAKLVGGFKGAFKAAMKGELKNFLKNGIKDVSKNLFKDICRKGHPVDVATGNVVDEARDFELPGPIPVIWHRAYCSAQASEETSLGVGGWALNWEQWIVDDGARWTLRAEEGRDIDFEKPTSGTAAFHRRTRLTLTAEGDGRFSVFDHATRQTKRFSTELGGRRAHLRSVEDAYGNAVSLYYEDDRLAQIQDTAGRTIRAQRDRAGHIVRVEVWAGDALASWVDYTYHPDGELASTRDAAGYSDAFEYDANHRMTKTVLKNGVAFYYSYDDTTGRCQKTWGDGGLHTVELTYDLEHGRTEVSGNTEPRVYYWDDFGIVRREETIDGRCLKVFDVDDDGFVVAEGVTENALTRHAYDALGNRIETTNAGGGLTRWTFEGDLPTSRLDPDGQTTEFTHDERGALVAVHHPSGLRQLLRRDPHGRLIEVREEDGVVASFSYDLAHNLVAEKDARGALTSYEYDVLGRPIKRVDPLDGVTSVERDVLGHSVEVRYPDQTVTTADYDALGNVLRTVDAMGQATEMEYAGTGVLTRFLRPDGHAWTIEYDLDERLKLVRNPLGERYEYVHDERGYLVSERAFDGRILSYEYSAEGYLGSIHYPDGSYRRFERDARGLILREQTNDSTTQFERDTMGRLTRATHTDRAGKSIIEMKRDVLGRVVEERQNDRVLQFKYDSRGRRVERSVSDLGTTRYGYDENANIAWVEHDGRRFDIKRDDMGRQTGFRAGSAFEIRSSYDAMGRLSEREMAGGALSGTGTKRKWSYDPLGRAREMTDVRWGTTLYEHDAVGQLLSAQRGTLRETFNYDPAGSLTRALETLSEGGVSRAWITKPGNRLVQAGDTSYEYDARGRRTKKTLAEKREWSRGGDVTEYKWDSHDRLREVCKPNGERVLFSYDALGRRTQKQVMPADGGAGAGRVVDFLWDGDELAADLDSERGTRVFVHDPGTFTPMLQAEQGELFAIVNDHLGMPKELVDQEGRVVWSASHSAWGRTVDVYQPLPNRGRTAVASPFRLLGQYADEETGLCYTRFRYFDSETGRWCSPDPLGFIGGEDLQGFNGSPIDLVDPLGLVCEPKKYNIAPYGKQPSPRSPLQAHHIIQDKWAKANIVGYDGKAAFTILLSKEEHAIATAAQNARAAQRVEAGLEKWSSSLSEEFGSAYRDLKNAGVPEKDIRNAMKKAYKFFY